MPFSSGNKPAALGTVICLITSSVLGCSINTNPLQTTYSEMDAYSFDLHESLVRTEPNVFWKSLRSKFNSDTTDLVVEKTNDHAENLNKFEEHRPQTFESNWRKRVDIIRDIPLTLSTVLMLT
jgi:hypothetical protein